MLYKWLSIYTFATQSVRTEVKALYLCIYTWYITKDQTTLGQTIGDSKSTTKQGTGNRAYYQS